LRKLAYRFFQHPWWKAGPESIRTRLRTYRTSAVVGAEAPHVDLLHGLSPVVPREDHGVVGDTDVDGGRAVDLRAILGVHLLAQVVRELELLVVAVVPVLRGQHVGLGSILVLRDGDGVFAQRRDRAGQALVARVPADRDRLGLERDGRGAGRGLDLAPAETLSCALDPDVAPTRAGVAPEREAAEVTRVRLAVVAVTEELPALRGVVVHHLRLAARGAEARRELRGALVDPGPRVVVVALMDVEGEHGPGAARGAGAATRTAVAGGAGAGGAAVTAVAGGAASGAAGARAACAAGRAVVTVAERGDRLIRTAATREGSESERDGERHVVGRGLHFNPFLS